MRPTFPGRVFWRQLSFAPTMVLCAVAGLFALISFLTACKAAGHR